MLLTMTCQILTTGACITYNDIRSVTLPGAKGEIQVLSKHAELFQLLKKGIISIRKDDEEPETMDISSGFCHFAHDTLTVILTASI